jgi:hypothetical protein
LENRYCCGKVNPSGDPEKYLFWDGVYLTDAAYGSITGGWLDGAYCTPGIKMHSLSSM